MSNKNKKNKKYVNSIHAVLADCRFFLIRDVNLFVSVEFKNNLWTTKNLKSVKLNQRYIEILPTHGKKSMTQSPRQGV